jgi:tetratricopeptide (TPR) repeat protein
MTAVTKSPGALYMELGASLYAADRYAEGVDSIKRALSEKSSDFSRADAYLVLARAQAALGENKDAVGALLEAVRLDPALFPEAQEMILRLRGSQAAVPPAAEQGTGLFSNIRNLFSKFASKASLPLRSIGLGLLEKGKFPEAESALRYYLAVVPDDIEAHEKLGFALLGQCKFTAAIESFLNACRSGNPTPSALLGLGQAHYGNKNYGPAEQALQRATEVSHDDPRILRLLGIVLREQQKLDESERVLRNLAEIASNNPETYSELAETLKAAGRASEATVSLIQAARLHRQSSDIHAAYRLSKEAAHLDPSSQEAKLELGRNSLAEKRFAEAVDALEGVTEPSLRADAAIGIAIACFFLKEYTKAHDAVEKVQLTAGETSEAFAIKGAILHRLKKPEEAATLLQACLNVASAVGWYRREGWYQCELGAACEALEKMTEAVTAFRRAVAMDPTSRWAHSRLGRILFQQRQFADAEVELKVALRNPIDDEAALDLAPALQPLSDAELQLNIGMSLLEQGKFAAAHESLTDALKLDPTSAEASYHRGRAGLTIGQYQEAVTDFQFVLDLEGSRGATDRPQVHAWMGEAYRALGRFARAEAAFRKALHMKRDHWTLARLGETLRVMGGRDEEARELLREATELAASDGWAWASYGAVLCTLQQYRSALAALEKAIELSPEQESAWTWGHRARVLRENSRSDVAAQAYDRALHIDPNASWIMVESAINIRRSTREYGAAASLLEKAFAIDPTSGHSLCELAICQHLLGRPQEALDSVEEGLSVEPGLTIYNSLKGVLLQRLGRGAEAEAAYQKALKSPDDPRSYSKCAVFYRDFEEYELAIRDLNKALELRPGCASFYNELAWTFLERSEAPVSASIKDLDTAVEFGRKAVELDRKGAYLDTLGWAYLKAGVPEQALPVLKEAADLCPENLEVEDHLLECQRKLGLYPDPADPGRDAPA